MYKLSIEEKQKLDEGLAAIKRSEVCSWEEANAEAKEIIRVAKLKARKGGINAEKIRRPALVAG